MALNELMFSEEKKKMQIHNFFIVLYNISVLWQPNNCLYIILQNCFRNFAFTVLGRHITAREEGLTC